MRAKVKPQKCDFRARKCCGWGKVVIWLDQYRHNYLIIWIVLHQNYFVGFSAETERTYLARKEMIKSFEGRMLPKLPPLKVFKPKSGNLPILSEYTKKLPAAYWSKWHKRTFDQVLPSKSWVDPLKLSQLAEGLRYGDADRL